MSEYDPTKPLRNTKHERYCQGIAEGKAQTQAFIDAGFSENSAGANASTLRTKKRIKDRIQALMQQLGEKLGVTREKQSLKLDWAQIEAKKDRDFPNYLRAIEIQSKHFGLMTDVVRDDSAESELAKSRRKEALEMAREAAKVIKIRKEA